MDRKEADREFIRYCEKQRKLDPKTIKSYRHVLEVFWNILDDHDRSALPDNLKKESVQYYIRRLNAVYRPASVQLHMNVVKTYFNYLEDMEFIQKTPFRRVRTEVRSVEKRPNVLSLNEIALILNAASGEKPESEFENMLYYRDCTILEFLFCTGMRVQELCDLTMDDIEPYNGIIHVIGKRKKYRKCYITADQTRAILGSYLRIRRKYLRTRGYRCRNLFINRFGAPISANAVRNLVTKYVKKADIDRNVTPHTFRHTFASILLEKGAELSYIQAYLGHSTISTTQIYLHISDESAIQVLRDTHPRSRMDLIAPSVIDS